MQAHIDGAKDEIEPVQPVPAPKDCDSDLLTVYPFGDPHAGLYAWEAETGEGCCGVPVSPPKGSCTCGISPNDRV